MIDAEERAAQQRSFYLKLSPQTGQMIAQAVGGFTAPGEDSQEHELKDNFGLWLKMHSSGAHKVISDTAWWMTHFMDRPTRLTKEEWDRRHGELTSYAIATMGVLMEQGIIKFVTEPQIPTLVTTAHDPVTHDIHQAILDRMEAGLKQEEKTDE